jgi:mono/diheme cytochrome c family protein
MRPRSARQLHPFLGRAVLAVTALLPSGAWATDQPEYNRAVRPILSENCFACHGPDRKARKGDLRLDLRAEAIERGAFVPGSVDKSELVRRIFSSDVKEQMPPPKSHKKLTDDQKKTLRHWVASGAEYQPHWAYIVPKRWPVPPYAVPALGRNPIDAFIQQALASKGIQPSLEADRRTLLRRLSLDLLGLPPTIAELRAFLADTSPTAYEREVDRLLKSPHFGERMAQHWLDVARYADTVGYHGDQNQNAWAYRDYVIAAFNQNKRFDEFTVEQLAGDLLPNPTVDQRVATCFNRLNMMTREGGAQPKEYLARYTADRIRTVGMAWLGSTLNCCECHDHKFDPFTTKDFYSIGAFFADIKQWGVYQDYVYTPNPNLKGWTNDHPWPPEIVVKSPTLERRMERLRGQIARSIAAAQPSAEAFATWKQETFSFLQEHRTGWEAPIPAVSVGEPTPPKNARRPRSKAEPPQAPSDSPPKSATKESAPKPLAVVETDGRIFFAQGPTAPTQIDVTPAPGWVASVKLELLPDARHSHRIVRAGTSTSIRPRFSIVHQGGQAQPLAVRHAQADHYAPHYVNGFETVGVQSAWNTDPAMADRPHTAVYFLDPPVPVASGDRVRLTLSDHVLGCLRVSTSRLAPAEIAHPEFSTNLARTLADPSTAAAYYLRSTAWNADVYARIKALEAEVLACRDGGTPVMVTEQTDKPLIIRVLPRGNWMDESGAICRPETPHFLSTLPVTADKRLTRLDLARWLCSAENPLTARAVVNRLWKQFFGAGLSAKVDDLGMQGEPPTHPELLDWLAVEFRESGWDVKHLVKLLVMSHTYRQASGPRPELRDLDPNNRLLASQNPRRLEAETVRDNALAIAGLLNEDMGGPPCKPYQPARYYEGLQFPDRAYRADRDERQYRRGIYMHWQRTFLHPMLANFDAPSREDCIAMRSSANSPQQALTLLNDPTFVEAARVWAGRLLTEPAADDAERLSRAFEQAVTRPPKPAERSSLMAFLTRVRAEYRSRPEDAARLPRVGLAATPPVDPIELAAWTNVCRIILNLHETITRF